MNTELYSIGSVQSTGWPPWSTRSLSTRLNGRLPKKPRRALSGEGCADSTHGTGPSIALSDWASRPHRIATRGWSRATSAPVIDELAGEYSGRVKVAKLDVDAEPGIASRYGVLSIPMVALFKDGELVFMMERREIEGRGHEPIAQDLVAAFEKHCSNATVSN